VLAGEKTPARDIVLLNAAAGLASFSLAHDPEQSQRPLLARLREQLERAEDLVESGRASAKLDEWVAATNR
jgi:anthranilate phosphoribosyltransferase